MERLTARLFHLELRFESTVCAPVAVVGHECMRKNSGDAPQQTAVCPLCGCESELRIRPETETNDRRVEVEDCVLCDHVVQHVAGEIDVE